MFSWLSPSAALSAELQLLGNICSQDETCHSSLPPPASHNQTVAAKDAWLFSYYFKSEMFSMFLTGGCNSVAFGVCTECEFL